MRASQLAGRTRRLIPPGILAARLRPEDPPAWRPLAHGLGVELAPQSGPLDGPEADGTFRAVGVTREFPYGDFWSDPSAGLLFLFHLHGFEPLARYTNGARTEAGDSFWTPVLESWLERYESPSLPAWHPFPTSLRLISWAAALSRPAPWPDHLAARMRAELWRQARYLSRAIEHDIGGNHVLKNATALVFSGVVCGSDRLREKGSRLLRRELARQILPDGGHEERSTSYHRQVTSDLCEVGDLLRRAGLGVPTWITETRARALDWQSAMTGPDGQLPLLNDAWEGPSLPPGRAPATMTHLSGTGHVVVRHGGDQAIFDVGAIGPRHLPPHAHADVLSFVLWGDGRPVIVDPGTFAYTGPQRDHFRSTLVHNTVQVDGRDQCELWGDFRAAFQPRVEVDPIVRIADVVIVAARHDGYSRLRIDVVHERHFIWCPGDGLIVVDRLLGEGRHLIRSRLQLPPRATREILPFKIEALRAGDAVREIDSRYSPYLGEALRATALEQSHEVAAGRLFGWALLRSDCAVTDVNLDRIVVARASGETLVVPLTRHCSSTARRRVGQRALQSVDLS